MKKLIIIFITVLSAISAMAQQSVSINKIWLEHGVTQNSQQGMQVHLSVQAIGFAKVNMTAVAYLDHPKGVGLRDTNGKYCTTDGTVAFPINFTPSYDNSTWNDMKIFIPYEEMHLLEGTRTYYCRVVIFKVNGGAVSNSQYVEFQGTVSQKENHNSNLTPSPNALPNGTKTVYYMNKAGYIASIFTKYYEKDSLTPQAYWGGQVFVYRGHGTGYIHYYSWDYNQNGAWVFKECDMYGRKGIDILGRVMSNAGLLYIANDWSYIKEGNEVFDIPISKEKFDSLQSSGYVNTGGGYNNSGSGSISPTQGRTGMSESYYREMYAQYERLAQSTYSTLTATGVDVHYNSGNREGYTGGSWRSSDYSSLKRDLSNAQSNMRRIRSEAAQAGYNITPSHWENATVSY